MGPCTQQLYHLKVFWPVQSHDDATPPHSPINTGWGFSKSQHVHLKDASDKGESSAKHQAKHQVAPQHAASGRDWEGLLGPLLHQKLVRRLPQCRGLT